MPYPRSKNKVHNLIMETRELEEQAGTLLLKIDENKKFIQKYFDENNIKRMDVPIETSDDRTINLVCKKNERATIKYDAELLKEKVDPEIFLEITNRTYTIPNIGAMISLVKDAGVQASRFKRLIDVKVTVDTQALKRLYDAGEINLKQLQGAYTATISKTIKITEETSEGN